MSGFLAGRLDADGFFMVLRRLDQEFGLTCMHLGTVMSISVAVRLMWTAFSSPFDGWDRSWASPVRMVPFRGNPVAVRLNDDSLCQFAASPAGHQTRSWV